MDSTLYSWQPILFICIMIALMSLSHGPGLHCVRCCTYRTKRQSRLQRNRPILVATSVIVDSFWKVVWLVIATVSHTDGHITARCTSIIKKKLFQRQVVVVTFKVLISQITLQTFSAYIVGCSFIQLHVSGSYLNSFL